MRADWHPAGRLLNQEHNPGILDDIGDVIICHYLALNSHRAMTFSEGNLLRSQASTDEFTVNKQALTCGMVAAE